MNLHKNGQLIHNLRKANGFTQKQIADQLHICSKTVSKWENGRGFPDISVIPELAKILGVSVDTILSGDMFQNTEEAGNMKNTKFYICPHCGSIMHGVGKASIMCCGKLLKALQPKTANDCIHKSEISESEDEYYIRINHEMTKEHFISFISYVTFDRVLTIKLYPEQDCAVRFPKMYGGRFYYLCNKHGLFEYSNERRKEKQHSQKDRQKESMTAVMTAFSKAYYIQNNESTIINDNISRLFFSDEEYEGMINYISGGKSLFPNESEDNKIKLAINKQFAPIPLARTKFCEDNLSVALQTGTEQYVILASGFDTYAYRNKNKKIKIFEIDKETTIHNKKFRLRRAGIEIPENVKLIAADLAKDNIKDLLIKNGYDTNKKTYFSCLGILYYLSKNEIEELFDTISELAADGSTVVFDIPDNHLFSCNIPRVKNMIAMADKCGEKMKSCFGYTELEKMLEEHNFYIYEFLTADDVQQRYFAGQEAEITAFEHINYVLSVLKKK